MGEEFRTADPEVTVALQGTIETFALPDVMRLLASTKKTGRLRVEGSRGEGNVWVDGGQIVSCAATGAPRAGGAVEVMFELLRFQDGSFVFDADEAPAERFDPVEVEATLAEAEKLLEEWRAIEAVVPSLDAWVSLAAQLPGDSVTLDRQRWSTIVAVGGGTTVGGLGEALELSDLDACRTVKQLVEDGLVTVGEAPENARLGVPPTLLAASVEETVVLEETIGSVDDRLASAEPAGVDEFTPFDPDALVIEREPVTAPAAVDSEPTEEPTPTEVGSEGISDPSDAAEIARQLANLSPRAAKAVAAAAKATTQEERERALAEVDDEEDPINRELLIKFLGSVNG
ncbi:DUF4388 domain-containing protein [Rhabdothermincola sp.]|uniref:DUF4388 domain-containing protein n=1 Tax=Rhabdothermincola sp. TaxID=2820405 RepID=UPI002FE2A613